MKALNLKGMSWAAALAMMSVASFAGCSDDDDENAPGGGKIEFPALQDSTLNAGSEVAITFNAAADWTLTSSAAWCKFVNGEFTESTIKGEAGPQRVTARVSDEGQTAEKEDVAEITLEMGGEKQVIYKITRPKKEGAKITVEDEEGNPYGEENPVLIKGNGLDANSVEYTIVVVKVENSGNAEIGIETPGWIKAEQEEPGKFSLTFEENNEEQLDPKYSFGVDKNYKLTFTAKIDGNEASASVPVCYDGLKADELLVYPQYLNLQVSEDGKTMKTVSVEGYVTDHNEGDITSTVTTRNDEYEIVTYGQKVYFEKGPGYQNERFTPLSEDEGQEYSFDEASTSWVHVAKDGITCSLTFDAFVPDPENPEASRSAVVLAFPKKVYEEIKDSPEEKIFDESGNLQSGYDGFIIADVAQRSDAVANKISFATYGMMGEELLPFTQMTGEEPIVNEAGNAYTGNFDPAWFGMDIKALYVKVINFKEGMEIETEGAIENLGIESQDLDGERYIVLEPASADAASAVKGSATVSVKSGEEVVATLKVNFE